jgi:hypothetical protein
MQDPAQVDLSLYFEELKQERSAWEGMWRDVARYTLPSSQFDSGGRPGQTLTESIYDGTSISASNILASEFLGMTLNPNSRNFEYHAADMSKQHDDKTRKFAQYTSDCIQYLLHCPSFGFYTAAHEMLTEYVRFGQGPFLVEKVDNKPRYLACPLSQTYTGLNENRKVDSAIRRWTWSLRQLRAKYPPERFNWPAALVDKLNRPDQMSMKVTVCHGVMPSQDHPDLARLCIFPKRYTHVIFLPEYKAHIIEVQGIDVFPMPTARYMMMAEESYGRGPGTMALPDTRMVNQMEKTNIRAVQKMSDPPMILPRRGWLRPIDVSPSALNYYDGLEDMKIQSFGIEGNPQMSAEFVNQHRMQIREMFGVDELMGPNKRAEMKEVEVLEDQEGRMRRQAPQLARLLTEWFEPTSGLLLYYFNDEIISGYDGELPDELQATGRLDLTLKYMSPLQRAQSMMDAANVKKVMDGFFLPVTQLDPTVGSYFSGADYVEWLTDHFNLPTKFMRSRQEAQAQVDRAKQQQNEAMAASTAGDASKAILNVAKAQQALPEQVPGQGVI